LEIINRDERLAPRGSEESSLKETY